MSSSPNDATRPSITRRSLLRTGVTTSAILSIAGVGNSAAARRRGRHGLHAPSIRGSVEQVVVTDAEPGATITLYGRGKRRLMEAQADAFGSHIFPDVEPAAGYQVTQTVDGDESPYSNAVRVLPVEYTPPDGFYQRQTLEEGFGYFEVRDGTTLACQVTFPDRDEWGGPPYPAIVDYSGYEPSTSFWDSIDDFFTDRGYAVVGVNKRGSACSGGKFDFMEPLQMLDGYDMVEVVGAQRWCDGVGLAGKSYPGYTQFFVAATQPPSLEAIVPGHVVGEFYRDVSYPGGMLNLTFAGSWATARDEETAPGGDRGDVDDRIAAGDEICEANQRLRLQNPSLFERLVESPFYTEFFRERAPWNLVDRIEVPTMLVMSWQDEQTGSRPARLLEQFRDDVPVRLIGMNGDHDEYFGPDVFADISRFLSYYLKGTVPADDDGPYEAALAEYEAEDPIQIYWEMDQNHSPRFETSYGEWPPADVETWELYFQPDGRLAESPPENADSTATSYAYTPRGPVEQLIPRDGEDRLIWPPQPDGTSAAFVSEPLDDDHVLLGSASVELWLESTADDTDVEVTLSEIRPDGTEMYVQNGWLRASHRAVDPARSKPRRPWQTHHPADQEPLPDDDFVSMEIEIFPFGHVFREGSQVKLAVESPGGNRDLWGFGVIQEPATNSIGHTAEMPSKLSLPLVPTEDADFGDPPECGTVRNQPCRVQDIETG